MPSATFGKTDPVHWPLLLTLTDSNWLPDTIMSAYQNLLQDQFPTIMFLNLKSSVTRRQLASRKVVVGYMNLNACHWIAAKLDMTQNLATIADSLYASFQQEHDAVFKTLQHLANTAGHCQELQRFTVDVPDQRNTNDCGVFACLFQLYMAQSVITRNTTLKYDTKPTARIMRKRIFTDLLAGKITPLIIKDEQ
jgi:Ulp1 family protease